MENINKILLTSFIVVISIVLVVSQLSGETISAVSSNNFTNFDESLEKEMIAEKAATSAQFIEYEVRPGDSLFKISQEYSVGIEEIMEINDLTSDLILIGQILLIPQAGETDGDNGFVYTVQPGDSLFLLARRFNTTISQIKSVNNLVSDIIYIDQELVIPGANESEDDNDGEEGKQKDVIKATVRGRINVDNKTARTVSLTPVKNEEYPAFPLSEPLSDREHEAEEIIVKYKPLIDVQSREKIEEQNNLEVAGEMKTKENMIVKYNISGRDKGSSIDSLLAYYNQLPTVEWAEPNYIFYPLAIPSDPYYEQYQWNLVNINMEAAWDMETGLEEVIVAVVDTGVIPDHPDLEGNLLQGADFVGGERSYPVEQYTKTDDDPTDETGRELGGSHGTHVAGIIGAVTNNHLGIAGISWDVSILPVRALKQTGGSSWDVAEGIYYAVDQGADIINLSLGGNNYSNLQHEAIKHALAEEVTVVAASGNEGRDNVYYPAAFSETIAVGAVDSSNQKTHYSNYGSEIDLVAPGGGYGESIYSTWGYYENRTTEASYAGMVGTSMAAPHVSGAAALLTASGRGQPEEIRRTLVETALPIGTGNELNYYGSGLLDVYAALRGERPDNPVVFPVVQSGGDILQQAGEKVVSDSEGNYQISEFQETEVYIAVWMDITGSGVLETGDFFGVAEEALIINEGDLKELDIQLNYISETDFELDLY